MALEYNAGPPGRLQHAFQRWRSLPYVLQAVTVFRVPPARLAQLNAGLRGMQLGNFQPCECAGLRCCSAASDVLFNGWQDVFFRGLAFFAKTIYFFKKQKCQLAGLLTSAWPFHPPPPSDPRSDQLRLGDLSGNRFRLVLRDVRAEGGEAAVAAAADGLRASGYINYFGLQVRAHLQLFVRVAIG